jgi:tetratricopeptide (TPR) repeat protein
MLSMQAVVRLHMKREQGVGQLIGEGMDLLRVAELAGEDTREEEIGLRIAGALLGRATGEGSETRASAERALDLYGELGDQWGASNELLILSWLDSFSGDYRRAADKLAEFADIKRAAGDDLGVALGALGQAYVLACTGETDRAVSAARDALATLRQIGSLSHIYAEQLWTLAYALACAGRYAGSQRHLEERLRINRDQAIHDSEAQAWLGWVLAHRGEYEHTGVEIGSALDGCAQLRAPLVRSVAWEGLGRLALSEEAYAEAECLLVQSVGEQVSLEHDDFEARVRCVLAQAKLGLGDLEEGRRCVLAGLNWTRDRGSFPVLIEALPAAARLLLVQGEAERAVEIYALACTLPAVANSVWFDDVVGKPIAQAAGSLPAAVVAAAKERGRARDVKATLDELIAEWTERTGDPSGVSPGGRTASGVSGTSTTSTG